MAIVNLSFFVPGKAQTAGSKRAFLLKRRDGSPVVNVVDANPNSGDWKGDVKRFVSEEYTGPLIEGSISLTLTFLMPRPKSHFGKNGVKDSAPLHPIVKPDVDKLSRAILDALTGILWNDDAQITTKLAKKRYVSHTLHSPGVLIEVTRDEILQDSGMQASVQNGGNAAAKVRNSRHPPV